MKRRFICVIDGNMTAGVLKIILKMCSNRLSRLGFPVMELFCIFSSATPVEYLCC